MRVAKTNEPDITREQMIQRLNEDLAREFQAMAEIKKCIDCLGDKSGAMSNAIKISDTPVKMLCTVLENERKMAEHYRERIRQAEAIGEFELSETLRAIIKQEYEFDFDAILGGPPSHKTDDNMFGSQ